jgi:hypothetical protein
MNISVKALDGSVCSLVVEPSHSVGDIKSIIQQRTNIHASQIRLAFAGKYIDEELEAPLSLENTERIPIGAKFTLDNRGTLNAHMRLFRNTSSLSSHNILDGNTLHVLFFNNISSNIPIQLPDHTVIHISRPHDGTFGDLKRDLYVYLLEQQKEREAFKKLENMTPIMLHVKASSVLGKRKTDLEHDDREVKRSRDW